MNKDNIRASRICGQIWNQENPFQKTTIKSTKLNAINLGQGNASFGVPDFFFDSFKSKLSNSTGNHNYTRNQGCPKLCQTISQIYSSEFGREIDPMTEILITPGGQSCLAYSCEAFVNPNEHIICIEPFFRMYLADFNLSDCVQIGVPMQPDQNGCWQLDYQMLEQQIINPKAKLLILNNPHNPTGKVFTRQELLKISELVSLNPNLVVLSDEVYERQVFDDLEFVRFASLPNMWERTLSMYSFGKTFSMTGIRAGFMVGDSYLIESVARVNIATLFCVYEPLQVALAESLEIVDKQTEYQGHSNYYTWLVEQYTANRNIFMKAFDKCELNIKYFCPQGGYFMVLDVSELKIDDKYYIDDDTQQKVHHDEAVANLFFEYKLGLISMGMFYINDQQSPKKYLRIAISKSKEETLKAAAIIEQMKL